MVSWRYISPFLQDTEENWKLIQQECGSSYMHTELMTPDSVTEFARETLET